MTTQETIEMIVHYIIAHKEMLKGQLGKKGDYMVGGRRVTGEHDHGYKFMQGRVVDILGYLIENNKFFGWLGKEAANYNGHAKVKPLKEGDEVDAIAKYLSGKLSVFPLIIPENLKLSRISGREGFAYAASELGYEEAANIAEELFCN